MSQSPARLGVDIGGTFTDVVLEIDSRQYSAKVLTTYNAPEDAILDGLHQVCEKADIKASDITQIIHGTTLATNALIERRGAKTALVTTQGFRDVIEMRTESRFEQYDLNLNLPAPLLPRNMRYTVKERVDALGNVLTDLDLAEVERLSDQIAEAGYDSVAVGLIHSYANDKHEKMVRDVLLKRLPNVMVSLSCEVSPQMREYERFNTVVANAYIKPLMKSYLSRLSGRVRKEGVDCSIFLMHSGGGIISIDSAAEFPVRLVESGPAGGAVFAANIAARYGLDKVLSFDMGGTTAKICLIKNQMPKTSRVFEVARTYRFKKGSGMPISIPVIDMVEIGAGGGSLARVDSMRQIRVGPESAGSEPGPACYGRGGQKPAVTDADLVLGKLDADNFAGGTIKLDKGGSNNALTEVLGKTLDMDAQTAAFGLAEVVDENMANAARVHAVENGEDLSEYTMIAFGGAAPLHAGRLCEKLSDFAPEKITRLLTELQVEAAGFVRSCDATADILSDYKVYMRYTGQGWEIPITLTAAQAQHPDAETFQKLFEDDYTKLFGRPVEGMDVEITVWAVNATTPPQAIEKIKSARQTDEATVAHERQMFDPALGESVTTRVVLRDSMQTGQTITGPAAITEDETTIIVPSSRRAYRQSDGCIDMVSTNQGAL